MILVVILINRELLEKHAPDLSAGSRNSTPTETINNVEFPDEEDEEEDGDYKPDEQQVGRTDSVTFTSLEFLSFKVTYKKKDFFFYSMYFSM